MTALQIGRCHVKRDKVWPWYVGGVSLTIVMLLCPTHFSSFLCYNSFRSQELGVLFSEVSALSGDNVLHSQALLASLLVERQSAEIDDSHSSVLQLHEAGCPSRCGC